MDIEEVAHNNPADIAKLFIDPLLGLPDYACRAGACLRPGFDKALIGKAVPFLKALYAAYVGTDATLAEINPLVVTKDGSLSRATPSGTLTRTPCSVIPNSPCSRMTRRRRPD